jgi:hypothetical protein
MVKEVMANTNPTSIKKREMGSVHNTPNDLWHLLPLLLTIEATSAHWKESSLQLA